MVPLPPYKGTRGLVFPSSLYRQRTYSRSFLFIGPTLSDTKEFTGRTPVLPPSSATCPLSLKDGDENSFGLSSSARKNPLSSPSSFPPRFFLTSFSLLYHRLHEEILNVTPPFFHFHNNEIAFSEAGCPLFPFSRFSPPLFLRIRRGSKASFFLPLSPCHRSGHGDHEDGGSWCPALFPDQNFSSLFPCPR